MRSLTGLLPTNRQTCLVEKKDDQGEGTRLSLESLPLLPGSFYASVSFPSLQPRSCGSFKRISWAIPSTSLIRPRTRWCRGRSRWMEATHGIAVALQTARASTSARKRPIRLPSSTWKTLKVTKTIALSGNPNLVDITPDGRFIYVAIALTYDDLSEFPEGVKANPTGGVDVIDTQSLQRGQDDRDEAGGVHDFERVTPDGKFVIRRQCQRRAGQCDDCGRHEDQRDRLGASDESRPFSDGGVEESRRFHQIGLRAKRKG